MLRTNREWHLQDETASSRSRQRKRQRSRSLRLEPLEGRTLLSAAPLPLISIGDLQYAEGVSTILDDDPTPTISFADFSDPSGLNLLGNASISADNRLRLTPAAPSQVGAAWYVAEKAFVSGSFETTFQFQLTEGADGFAFVIQNWDASFLGPAAASIGYSSLPNNLAVEFDTWQNNGRADPYNDPGNDHISVHTNGTDQNWAAEAYSLGVYGLTEPSHLDNAAIRTAKISYSPGILQVYLDDLSSPVLSVPVTLDEVLDLDGGRAWVGFTAATGGAQVGNHDILSWDYTVLADTTTTIGINDVSSAEGDDGTSNLEFTVFRLGDASGTTTVNWATADGTATAGSDYTAASGQITFGPGVTEQTIPIRVTGDTDEESHETFFVNLSNAVGATIVDTKGTGTISNDDAGVSIPLDLGVVDFLRLPSQTSSGGELQYQLTTAHDGYLTIEALSNSSTVVLLDLDRNLLATSSSVNGVQRIDWPSAKDETYLVRLSGAEADIELHIADLLHHEGTTVTVHGTAEADLFRFNAESSRVITINGVAYSFDNSDVSAVTFDADKTATDTGSDII